MAPRVGYKPWMVFMFHVTKLRLGALKVQVLHHEVRLLKMWKMCVKSVMRSVYVWCLQTFWAHHIVHYDIWTKDLRQIAEKFVPICWKMTRNKTNLLCARAYKNRPKRKETSILRSEQEMKAGFMAMSQEQISSHPSGGVILLPS